MDKVDRVGQKELRPTRDCDTPHGRIECGEKHVGFKDLPFFLCVSRSRPTFLSSFDSSLSLWSMVRRSISSCEPIFDESIDFS